MSARAALRRAAWIPGLALLTLAVAPAARRVLHAPAEPPPVGAPLLPPAPSPSVAVAGAPPADAAVAAAPTTAHGGPRRTGQASGVVRGPLRIRWQRAVGGAVAAEAVTNGAGTVAYVTTLAGDLVALSVATGEIAFRVPLGDRGYAAPAVASDGTIYAGSDAGAIVAVTPAGAVRFTTHPPKVRHAPRPEIDTALLLVDGPAGPTLVHTAGASVVFLAPDGSERARWTGSSKVYTAPAALPDGAVVIGDQGGDVRALGVDGTVKFVTHLGPDVDGSPAVFPDGRFVVGFDGGGVAALDGAGKILWRTTLPGHVRGPLSIGRDGDVRVGHFGAAPALVRLRGRDGAVEARLPFRGTGSAEFGLLGGPVEATDGALLFGTPHDELVHLRPDGAVARTPLDGDVDAPPTLLPTGEVLVATRAGSVYLLAP